jgi:hypothetical protein
MIKTVLGFSVALPVAAAGQSIKRNPEVDVDGAERAARSNIRVHGGTAVVGHE